MVFDNMEIDQASQEGQGRRGGIMSTDKAGKGQGGGMGYESLRYPRASAKVYPGAFPAHGKVDFSDHEEFSSDKIDICICTGTTHYHKGPMVPNPNVVSINGYVDRNVDGCEILFTIEMTPEEAKGLRDTLVYALEDTADGETPDVIPDPRISNEESPAD
jgi:hypothetical protein